MARERKLTIVLAGDAKGALKAFGETEAGASSLGGKLKGLAPTAKQAGALAATGVAVIGAALFEVGSEFDAAYDKIRVGTGATGDVLEGLKDDFRAVVAEVPASFEDASTAISKLAQITGDEGPILQGLSEQFLELSRITGTDLAGNIDAGAHALMLWNIPVTEQSAKMDELFRASQLTGVGFADLATQITEAGPQLQALGFNFDQATTVVAGLGKAGLSVSDVLPAMSKAMAVGAKEGKSAEEVWQGLFRSIKGAPNDVAASTIAFDELGAKAGPKLAELIRSGQLSFDDLGASIAEGSDTIIGAGKETQDFSEKFQLFKNQALLAIEPIATRVFDKLGQGMEWLGEHKPVLTAIAIVIGGALVIAFTAWAISAASAAVATIAATWPLLAVLAAIGLLVAGIVWLTQNWDIVSAKVTEVVDSIKAKFGEGVDWVMDKVDTVISFFQSIPGRAADALGGLRDAFADAIRNALNALIGIWNALDLGIHLGFEIPSWVPGVGGKGFHFDVNDIIPDVGYLAQGGVTTGPMLAVIGDNPSGREAVIPLERAGEMGFSGGGDHYHFHNHGIIASQAEAERWLLSGLEKLGNGGRKLGPGGRKLVTS